MTTRTVPSFLRDPFGLCTTGADLISFPLPLGDLVGRSKFGIPGVSSLYLEEQSMALIRYYWVSGGMCNLSINGSGTCALVCWL